MLGRYLQQQGFQAELAATVREARQKRATGRIDLIVLDVLLPDGTGFDFCKELRSRRDDIPIILLTALKEEVDRIIGLEIGADDYLGKPFNPRELVARIRAVLRRGEAQKPATGTRVYRFAGFSAEPHTRVVTGPDGATIDLTGAEFDLLQAFLDRPGRILSRDQLLDLTHTGASDVLDRSIDVLVSRLRRKIGDQAEGALFKTIRNGGYQLAVPVVVETAS